MNNIKIITLNPIFNEPAIVLSQRLKIDIITNFDPSSNEIYIVYGAHEKAIELLNHQRNLKHSYGYIIMNSEPPSSNTLRNKYYIELMKTNIVFDYHSISSEYLKTTYDINVRSYHFFDFPHYEMEETERDIDILFVGTHCKKREEIFIQLQFQYPDKKIEFVFDNSLIAPIELTKKLQKTKIVLNIPFYEHKVLETHRINKALSCGCKVVAKKSGDETTDNLYEDYVYFVDDYTDNIDLNKIKKPYTQLQSILTNNLTANNKWYIEQMISKNKKSNNI